MKIAEFSRHKFISNKRSMYAVWLNIKDGKQELFNGPVDSYRPQGYERHLTQLIIDSMKIALTAAGYTVIGEA